MSPSRSPSPSPRVFRSSISHRSDGNLRSAPVDEHGTSASTASYPPPRCATARRSNAVRVDTVSAHPARAVAARRCRSRRSSTSKQCTSKSNAPRNLASSRAPASRDATAKAFPPFPAHRSKTFQRREGFPAARSAAAASKTASATADAMHCEPASCTSNHPARYVANPNTPARGRPSVNTNASGAPAHGGFFGKDGDGDDGDGDDGDDGDGVDAALRCSASVAASSVDVATPSASSASRRSPADEHTRAFLRIVTGALRRISAQSFRASSSPNFARRRAASHRGTDVSTAKASSGSTGQSSPVNLAPPRSTAR